MPQYDGFFKAYSARIASSQAIIAMHTCLLHQTLERFLVDGAKLLSAAQVCSHHHAVRALTSLTGGSRLAVAAAPLFASADFSNYDLMGNFSLFARVSYFTMSLYALIAFLGVYVARRNVSVFKYYCRCSSNGGAAFAPGRTTKNHLGARCFHTAKSEYNCGVEERDFINHLKQSDVKEAEKLMLGLQVGLQVGLRAGLQTGLKTKGLHGLFLRQKEFHDLRVEFEKNTRIRLQNELELHMLLQPGSRVGQEFGIRAGLWAGIGEGLRAAWEDAPQDGLQERLMAR
jgi:hypothetical protein